MTLLTFIQVVARYVFNYSFVWALELNGVLFAWLIFIGMSYGVRVGAHIGIDAAGQVAEAGGGARGRHGRRDAVHRLRGDRRGRRLAVRAQDVRRRHRDAGPADPAVDSAPRSCRSASRCSRCASRRRSSRLARGEKTRSSHDEAAEALKLREQAACRSARCANDDRGAVRDAVRVHAARHAGRGRARPVVAADDPVLRARTRSPRCRSSSTRPRSSSRCSRSRSSSSAARS